MNDAESRLETLPQPIPVSRLTPSSSAKCQPHVCSTQVPTPGNVTTYRQRYYVCAKSWRPDGGDPSQLQQPSGTDAGVTDTTPGPIFFYMGNEGDVLL